MNTQQEQVRPSTLIWRGEVEGYLEVIDQRRLPVKVEMLRLETVEGVWEAIRGMAVRGAPAIGVCGAYGMVLAARTVGASSQAAVLIELLRERAGYLKSARPTAVNLEWAVDQMLRIAITERAIGVRQLQRRLLTEAHGIREDDLKKSLAIGRNGVEFIAAGAGILTHCNAGGLGTCEHGTALAILYEAQRRGISFRVYAGETRPLLQGSRLTAWELGVSGVDVTVICDSAAGMVMQQGKISAVLVGADRIARNGDTANKIGTYSLAQLARSHGVPFYVAAPSNTFDLSLANGGMIPIEERAGEEITEGFGTRTAPVGVKSFNPAFDVTPAGLITAIVTERGVISPVGEREVVKVVEGG